MMMDDRKMPLSNEVKETLVSKLTPVQYKVTQES
jgi:hypothetical protein